MTDYPYTVVVTDTSPESAVEALREWLRPDTQQVLLNDHPLDVDELLASPWKALGAGSHDNPPTWSARCSITFTSDTSADVMVKEVGLGGRDPFPATLTQP